MITVIAGKSHGGKKTRIISLNDVVGTINEFEFEAESRADIKPGEPKWANYVKGCIANFICKSFAMRELHSSRVIYSEIKERSRNSIRSPDLGRRLPVES